jgi:phosphoribosylformylglycinamidine cyclo-ligase
MNMTTSTEQTYAGSGVDYSAMDPIKVLAQQTAAATAVSLKAFKAEEVVASRGESAYVWEESDAFRALVVEGLGTKNLVADAVRSFTGKTHYDSIAQDTVAMIVNDLIVVGALPQVVNAYFAIGDSNWMLDKERASDLIDGWAQACRKSGATWGGGETPTLKGIVDPTTIDLAGSAVGIVDPKQRLVLGNKLVAGDVIVLIESSGIHANGITFVRGLVEKTPGLYERKLSDGRMFGEAILTPTHLYVELVRTVMEAELDVHYMVNITGHGWRKLMRATKNLTYIIDDILLPQPEFLLMQELGQVSDREMYGNFNMGAGFAFFAPRTDSERIVQLAADCGFKATVAGHVELGLKQVVITPKNITFTAESLEVR